MNSSSIRQDVSNFPGSERINSSEIDNVSNWQRNLVEIINQKYGIFLRTRLRFRGNRL